MSSSTKTAGTKRDEWIETLVFRADGSGVIKSASQDGPRCRAMENPARVLADHMSNFEREAGDTAELREAALRRFGASANTSPKAPEEPGFTTGIMHLRTGATQLVQAAWRLVPW